MSWGEVEPALGDVRIHRATTYLARERRALAVMKADRHCEHQLVREGNTLCEVFGPRGLGVAQSRTARPVRHQPGRRSARPRLGLPPYRAGQAPALVGLALKYGEVTRVPRLGLTRFTAGALTEFLQTQPDVRVVINHQHAEEFGSIADGALTLMDTPAGLTFHVVPIPTPAGQRVMAAVQAGRLFGVSCRVPRRKSVQQRDVLNVLEATVEHIGFLVDVAPASRTPWAAVDSPKARRRLDRAVLGLTT